MLKEFNEYNSKIQCIDISYRFEEAEKDVQG